MKFGTIKFLLFALLCVFCFAILFISLNNDIKRQGIQDFSVAKQDYYTIKEYEGKIAVYKNAEASPYVIYDSYTSLLPEQDRQRLKKGIVTDDTEYLQKVIEDYTS